MHLNFYQNKTSNVWAENRLLKFVVVVMGLSSVISIFMSIHAINRQKVVILPPVVDKRIVISGNDVIMQPSADVHEHLSSTSSFTRSLRH